MLPPLRGGAGRAERLPPSAAPALSTSRPQRPQRRPPSASLGRHGRAAAGPAREGAGGAAAAGGAGPGRELGAAAGRDGPGAAVAAGRVDAGHRAGRAARRRRRLGPAAGRQRRFHRAGRGAGAAGPAVPQRRYRGRGNPRAAGAGPARARANVVRHIPYPPARHGKGERFFSCFSFLFLSSFFPSLHQNCQFKWRSVGLQNCRNCGIK